MNLPGLDEVLGAIDARARSAQPVLVSGGHIAVPRELLEDFEHFSIDRELRLAMIGPAHGPWLHEVKPAELDWSNEWWWRAVPPGWIDEDDDDYQEDDDD